MTPIAIREAINQTHYLVVCDACHGRMFHDGIICAKCNGDGRVLVTDEPVTHVSRRLLCVLAVVCFAVAAVAAAVMLIFM